MQNTQGFFFIMMMLEDRRFPWTIDFADRKRSPDILIFHYRKRCKQNFEQADEFKSNDKCS